MNDLNCPHITVTLTQCFDLTYELVAAPLLHLSQEMTGEEYHTTWIKLGTMVILFGNWSLELWKTMEYLITTTFVADQASWDYFVKLFGSWMAEWFCKVDCGVRLEPFVQDRMC